MAIEVLSQPIEKALAYEGTATGLHAQTLSRLMARRKLSERAMSRRYDDWQRCDEHTRLFINLDRKARHGDKSESTKAEMPWARSIVVPMSYAILQVDLTQQMGIFTKRDPPIEISGIGPEDIRPAKLMNATIAYDQVQTNYTLELYTALQDAFKYGMGGFHDCWEEEHGWKMARPHPLKAAWRKMLGLPVADRKWDMLREYNKVEAWDPYNFYPDPRVSLSNIQKGEFVGHRLWRGYHEILAGSIENGGNYFNVRQVATASPKAQALRSRNRFQASQMNLIGSTDEKDKGFHAIDSFVVSIIPQEWKLGKGDRPEKWQFTWVDDQVIIRAHRADYDHGQFNYSAFETNIDTHVFGNQGDIENLDGLQRFMNWKYNSHVQNLIRFLNNRMVYASSFIEAFDVENPDAAMHVRLTALGEQMIREGKMTIPQMIMQLQLTDVTGPMMQSLNQDFDFAMRMSGAADQMMGRMTTEKRTLGEVNRVGHEGSNRQSMRSGMMETQGIRPTVLRWCSNRQQYTSQEQYYRIGGRTAAEFGGKSVMIKPEDLYGNYDFAGSTGNDPMEKDGIIAVLQADLEAIGKNPALLGMPDKDGNFLDVHEMLKELNRLGGVRNVEDFYRAVNAAAQGDPNAQQALQPNVQVMPDEQVQQQVQAGNVVPMRAAA